MYCVFIGALDIQKELFILQTPFLDLGWYCPPWECVSYTPRIMQLLLRCCEWRSLTPLTSYDGNDQHMCVSGLSMLAEQLQYLWTESSSLSGLRERFTGGKITKHQNMVYILLLLVLFLLLVSQGHALQRWQPLDSPQNVGISREESYCEGQPLRWSCWY